MKEHTSESRLTTNLFPKNDWQGLIILWSNEAGPTDSTAARIRAISAQIRGAKHVDINYT